MVDSIKAENSLPALQAAIERGYQMVEIDMRLTKDSIFIINHDADFKKYYGIDKPVNEMYWKDISLLKNKTNDSRAIKLEDVFKYCSSKIAVMIDNKINGNDTILYQKVITLLKKYRLDKDALMIGTDESTAFFTGKVRLSCTRKQLEENMKKPGYRPEKYYLFGNELSKADVEFAQQNGILAVGVVNAWRYKKSSNPEKEAANDAAKLKETGLKYFQID